LALVGGVAGGASAQCPTGQLDYDYDLGTLDDLFGNVLVNEQGTNLWLNGSPPVWQNIPGQVGPGFRGVDNDGNGILDDDHFDMLAAVLNGNDAQVLANLNPATVSAIRNAFEANKVKTRTTKVTLCNVKINGTALGFVPLNFNICVTTGETTTLSFAGQSISFDVPPLWGPDGILAEVDPQLEERIVNLAAGYITIGDQAGISYFQNVLGQVTLSALNALIPQLLSELKSTGDPKDVPCSSIQPIEVTINDSFDGISINATIRVESQDICNAINTFINTFSCGNGFSCQTSFLAASGNLNGAGTNNSVSYLNATTRQEWLEAESIVNPPLQIVENPASLTVESGTPTTLDIGFIGGKAGATYNYRWETIDSEAFVPSGTVSTTESLQLGYPLPANTGLYAGVVCDGLWQRRSQPASLTVNAGTFRIVTQPQGASGLVPGESFALTVQVRGGNSVPSYQWQFDNGGGFVNVGGNSNTLDFPSIDLPDSGQYRCVITGDSTLTSDTVTVQVVDSIRFQTQPAPQAVYVGESVSFEPVIIGQPVGTINYEWRRNDNPIEGANGPTLSFPSAQLGNNGTYTLRIFDDTYDVLSQGALLEVALQPNFTQQPVGGGGFEGNDYTFSVQVAGGLTFLNYQWYFTPDEENAEAVTVGTNSPTLTLTDLTPANQGTYYVEVTDLRQTITSNTAFLTIFPPFDIVTQPQGATKYVGDGHTFTVGIEGGTGTISYQWLKNGQPVGTNNPSLTIDPLTQNDSGTYVCVVSDDNGSNTSDPAVLDVRNRLSITQQPTNVGVYVGQSVTLTIQTTGGIGDIEYRWKRGSVTVGFGQNFLIPEATLATNGTYRCEVSDDNETVTSNTVTITAVPPVTFPTQPKDVYRFIGDSAQFSVVAQDGLGNLNYRWFKDNKPLPYTGTVLFFEKVFLADAGTYRCEVTDDLFTTSSEGAQLYVFEEPDSNGVDIESTLTGQQVVPPTEVSAEGSAFGRLRPVAGSPTGEFNLVMNLVHGVTSPTRIRMRKGVVGENGPVLLLFNSPTSPSTLNRNFTRAEAAEMLGGFFYVTVETSVFPEGAIRGQLNGIIPAPEGEVIQPCSNAVTGSLSACSDHYNRIESANINANCGASSQDVVHNDMPYNAIKFTWAGTTQFTAEVQAGGTTLSDTVLSLYCDPFLPNVPAASLVAFDDDGGAEKGLSAFTAADNIFLTAGQSYWLVVSTFRGDNTSLVESEEDTVGDFGDYRICLPSTAIVTTVSGTGDENCFVAEEGEGVVEGEGEGTIEGGTEGEGEGTVEGGEDGEGVLEGEGEGVVEGEGEGVVEGEGEVEGSVEGEGEGDVELPLFTADLDGNGEIDLPELLRVIQLFNAGAYYCISGESEDGYGITPEGIAFGDPGCERHASDYDDEPGVIQLSELLRLIQFFNLGGVVACPGETEDNFCVVAR
jgi:hypothetical protein